MMWTCRQFTGGKDWNW